MISRSDILQRISLFPSLSDPASEINEWYQRSLHTRDALLEMMERNTPFCNKIVRLAQSLCIFPFSSSVTIQELIQDATEMEFFSLAIMLESTRWILTLDAKNKNIPFRLNEHSLAVGVGVPVLADFFSMDPPDFMFITGYLHDIGKAVMEKSFSADSAVILDYATQNAVSVDEAERRLLGIDHMEVGALILRQWRLPTAIVDAVRWHHLPGLYEGVSPLLDLVHIADAIALMMGIGPQSEGMNYQTSPEVKARFDLKIGMIEEVISRIQEKLELMKNPFAVIIGE